MHLPTLFLASASIATAVAQSFCTPGSDNTTTLIPGTTCSTECSLDRPGGDIAAVRVPDLAACAEACNNNAQCLDAQFLTENSFCYLKNFITNPTPSDTVSGVICRTCAQGQQVPNTGCVQECGIDRPGSDFRMVPFDGPNAFLRCAQECNGDSECVTAQYRADNRVCYLKTRANEAVADANVNGIVCPKTSAT